MKQCWLICSFINAIKIGQLIRLVSGPSSFRDWSRCVYNRLRIGMSTLCSIMCASSKSFIYCTTITHNSSFFFFFVSLPLPSRIETHSIYRCFSWLSLMIKYYLQSGILFNDKLMIKLNKLNKYISFQERNEDKRIKRKKWRDNLYLFIDPL